MAPLSSSSLDEAPPPTTSRRGGGGWITAPFIIVTMFGLTLAATGWINNLIVFLINNFHVKTIDAAQINNVVSGCVNFFPLVGAIIADSLLSCFSVIWISSLISLLGLILLLLTVTVESLKPDSTPSTTQYAVLYSALALVSIGVGGTRFTLATMGANQLKKFSQHSSFFDWYFFGFYSASFIGATGIVYVEDNMRWSTGFLICIAANVVALALFLSGSRYYTREERRESPFTGLFRVLVASVRKRKAVVSSQSVDYYHGDEEGAKGVVAQAPTKRFRADRIMMGSGFSGQPSGHPSPANRPEIYIRGQTYPDKGFQRTRTDIPGQRLPTDRAGRRVQIPDRIPGKIDSYKSGYKLHDQPLATWQLLYHTFSTIT